MSVSWSSLLVSCLVVLSPAALGVQEDSHVLVIGEHVFVRRELANGLQALAIRDEGQRASVFMAIAAGNRNETAETTGLAHLTEHAMFAGTPTTGTDVHEGTIKGWGGESNAFTRDDYTMYYDHEFPAAKLEQVLVMEADRLRNLSLDPAPTLHERERLIIEETHSYQPSEGRSQQLESVVFTRHPYRYGLRDRDGHTRAIHLGVEDIRSFYNTHYRPNRVAVVVVGPEDPNSVLDRIETAFGPLARGADEVLPGESIPAAQRAETIHSDLARDRQVACWMTPAMSHADRPALEVLAGLLGQEELDCGVPLSVSLGGRVDEDFLQIGWSTTAEDEKAVAAEVQALLDGYRAGRLDPNALEQVKMLLSTRYSDEPLRARPYFALAARVAWHAAFDQTDVLAGFGAAVTQVQAADVARVAEHWLSADHCVHVLFEGTGVDVAPLTQDPKELRIAAAEAIEIGDTERAVEAYSMLLRLSPSKMNQVIFLAERGGVHMGARDFDEAISDFTAALEVIDYPAVRDMLEEAHARKARALRGVFDDPEPETGPTKQPDHTSGAAQPHGAGQAEPDLRTELSHAVEGAMRELEEWRGLKFSEAVVPDFVNAEDVPDASLGGWYESRTKRLVVVMGKEGKGADFTRGVQLHEIFHALQDQNWDLSALHAACEGADENRALQSLIEGEAMLAVADLMHYDFAQHAKIPQTGPMERARFEKLFHYGTGLEFVRTLRDSGGWEAIDKIWKSPPQATAQLYHPERYGLPTPAVTAEETFAALGLALPEGEILKSSAWGEFELRWLLVEDEGTRELAASIGPELEVDRHYLFRAEDGEPNQELWHLVFTNSDPAHYLSLATPAFRRGGWSVAHSGRTVTLTRAAR